ncbi:MAG: hypothetical protein KJ906_02725 [Nanoarchaeota archaeon]|nr:hypothetical protein [Nanoarchaeota archaeon]
MQNKVKIIKVLDTVTLESTEAVTQAATSRVIVDTYYSDQLNLVCNYLTGAGETLNNAYIKVWGYAGQYSSETSHPYSSSTNTSIAADSTNWIQLGTYDISSGTATFTPTLLKIAGAAAATTYPAHFALGITFPKIRVSAYEDGVASAKGRLSVTCLIQ